MRLPLRQRQPQRAAAAAAGEAPLDEAAVMRRAATAEGDAPLAAAFDAAEEAVLRGAGDAPAEEALQLPLRLLRHWKRLQKRCSLPLLLPPFLQQMNRLQLLSPLLKPQQKLERQRPQRRRRLLELPLLSCLPMLPLPWLPLQPDLHHSMPRAAAAAAAMSSAEAPLEAAAAAACRCCCCRFLRGPRGSSERLAVAIPERS